VTSESLSPDSRTLPPALRIFTSVISGIGSNLLLAAMGAVVIGTMTRSLGASSYGVFLTALNITSIIGLVTDLGINSITGREISKNPSLASEILGTNLAMRITLNILLVPVSALFSAQVSHAGLTLGIWLMAFSLPFDSARIVAASAYVSSIKNHIPAILATLRQGIFVIGVIGAVATHRGVDGCFEAYFSSTLACGVAAHFIAQREVRFKPLIKFHLWLTLVKQSIHLGLIQVINLLYLKADILLIGALSSNRLVGIYGVAYAVVTLFSVIPSTFMTAMLPLLSRASDNEFKILVSRSVQWMCFLSALILVGIINFGRVVLYVFAGKNFFDAYVPLVLLSIGAIFTFMNAAFGFASVAKDSHRKLWVVSLLGLAINILANLWVIPRYGLTGAAGVTLATEILTLWGVKRNFETTLGLRVPLLQKFASATLCIGLASGTTFWLFGRESGYSSMTLLSALFAVAVFLFSATVLKLLPDGVARVIRTRVFGETKS